MAAEQRIIGGGLLFVGLLILVILLYFFGGGGLEPREAYAKLASEIWPAWKEAEQGHDYDRLRELGKQAYGIIEDAGRARMIKYVQAEAATDQDARRLKSLVEHDGFKKNGEGLYQLGDAWYPETTHAALSALTSAVDDKLKVLREIRRIAGETHKALDQARQASRLPLELPEAHAGPAANGPVPADSPLFVHDRELFRVFGLDAEALEGALKTANQGGASRPPRLVWNRDVAGGTLAAELADLPTMPEKLVSLAAQIELQAERLHREGDAEEQLKTLLRRAATLLGDGLTGEQREAYFSDLKPYESTAAIGQVLRWEAGLLDSYQTTIRPLAPMFSLEFGLD